MVLNKSRIIVIQRYKMLYWPAFLFEDRSLELSVNLKFSVSFKTLSGTVLLWSSATLRSIRRAFLGKEYTYTIFFKSNSEWINFTP